MTDIFGSYERGLTVLVRWLSSDHPRYTEALTFQNRLLENIHQARRHGDTETRRADRAQIMEQLNNLALAALGTSFNELCEYQSIPSASESADVRGLLEAMGYRIADSRAVGKDLYFLCDVRWGAEICQEVVHFVGGEPRPGDIAALNDAVTSHDAIRGILLTQNPLLPTLRELAGQRKRIRCYTLNEFTDRLADFRLYLEHLIQEYEASEIPAFYVPLAVECEAGKDQGPEIFSPLESFADAWLSEPGRNHLSILGDFGSGKTWFCQRYAYLTAMRYLDDPVHNRIPILITLRDYSRAYDMKQLITDAISNQFKVALVAGYETFARLNEAGRILIIFDGFDEMERRVSDYRTTVDNFWELAKVVCSRSKILLTCRTAYFRHRGEEEETLTPRRRQVKVAVGDQVIDLRGRQQFEVAHLLDFNGDDIKLALQKRLPARWEPVYEKIQELTSLRDLARRPVLLEMIVKTLPQIQDATQINQATLYETYVEQLLKRRWTEDTDYVSPQERLSFMQELALEMYHTHRLAIPFSEFPERVRQYYGLEDNLERAAFFERDVRTQSYLVRDDAGNYRFAHKSFMEYFAARRMVDSIRDSNFNVEKAMKIWGMQALTPEIQDFLVLMVADPAPLWRLMRATQDKVIADVGYTGGNAATVLKWKGQSFIDADLAGSRLLGADYSNADLSGANFQRVCLQEANISGAMLENVDLRGADLTSVRVEEMGGVMCVAWSADGRYLASAGEDTNVRVWDTRTWREIAILRGHVDMVRCAEWHPQQELLATGSWDSSLKIWNTSLFREVTSIEQEFAVFDLQFSPNGQVIASTPYGYGVTIWEAGSHPSLRNSITDVPTSVNPCVCYSKDGHLLAVGAQNKAILYESTSFKVRFTIEFSENRRIEVNDITFAHETEELAISGMDGRIRIWSVASGQHILDCIGHTSDVTSLSYNPANRYLASGSWDQTVRVWDTSCGDEIAVLKGHRGAVNSLAHSPDGRYLASGSNDGTVRIWDIDPHSFTFGQYVKILEVKMNCQGMRIGDTKGLEAPAPDGKGTLRDWFVARGAVE